MNGRTHLIIGIAMGMGAAAHLGVPLHIGAGLGALGGLLPDIDHPQSYISSFVPFAGLIPGIVGGHRGLTHSLLAVVALTAAAHYAGIDPSWIMIFAAGYVSHLIADCTTPAGVPLLMPLQFKFKILPGVILSFTGWLIEAAAALASVAAIGWLLWMRL